MKCFRSPEGGRGRVAFFREKRLCHISAKTSGWNTTYYIHNTKISSFMHCVVFFILLIFFKQDLRCMGWGTFIREWRLFDTGHLSKHGYSKRITHLSAK